MTQRSITADPAARPCEYDRAPEHERMIESREVAASLTPQAPLWAGLLEAADTRSSYRATAWL